MKFGHEINDMETAIKYTNHVVRYQRYLKEHSNQDGYVVKNHLQLCSSFINDLQPIMRKMASIIFGDPSFDEGEVVSTINTLINKYFYTIDLDREFSVD